MNTVTVLPMLKRGDAMPTKNLSREQLEDVMWRITVLALDLDKELEYVQKRVRISWPTSETGNSSWNRDENVVFIRIVPGFDDYGNLHDQTYESDPETGTFREVVTYHRCYSVTWVCYGPDADADAENIRIGLFRADVQQYLHEKSLAFLPHIPPANRIPEPDEAGEWWERCDLTAQCYELVRREYAAKEMLVAPNIILKTK